MKIGLCYLKHPWRTLFLIALLHSSGVSAYEVATHALLSDFAYSRSVFGASDSPPNADHITRHLGFVLGNDSDLLDKYFDLDSQGNVRVRFTTLYDGNVFDTILSSSNLDGRTTKLNGWLARGAVREDDLAFDPHNLADNTPQDEPGGNFQRVFGHFYDPRNDRALTVGPVVLGVRTTDWALDRTAEIPYTVGTNPVVGANHFGVSQAREYMWRALTLTTRNSDGTLAPIDTTAPLPTYSQQSSVSFTGEQMRLAYWASVFKSVGDMIHLLEDMAQPQHTRNDAHSGELCIPYVQGCAGGHGSFYERYIDARAQKAPLFRISEGWFERKDSLPLLVPTAGLSLTDLYAKPLFQSYGAFFSSGTGPAVDSGTGIADYSNRGFYSFGTNIGSDNARQLIVPPATFPSSGLTKVTVQNEKGMDGSVLPAPVTYIEGNVHDSNFNNDEPAVRLSTDSAFDQFLQPTYLSRYSLNYHNYDDQQRLLVPRAIAYSAGFIDYFFRGRMTISLPDEGVYAVVDHTLPQNNDPQTGGFGKVKLKLQNLSTAGLTDDLGNPVIEQMAEGAVKKLYAVAKFHRNGCYKPDLSGEYGSQGQDWSICRGKDEEVVVSDAADVPTGINAGPVPVTFTFSTKKIPISATDLYLQVVYRGQLGSEADAVVVETKDISEPTYGFNVSRWDQYKYSAPWPDSTTGGTVSYDVWCTSGNPAPPFPSVDACNSAMGLTDKTQFAATSSAIANFDPNGSNPGPQGTWMATSSEPVASPLFIATAPVGTMTRVAWLTDAVPINTALDIDEAVDETHNLSQFEWFTGISRATVAQVDPITHALQTPLVTYLPSRPDSVTGSPLFVPADLAVLLTNKDVAELPPLTLKSSIINF
jgi:hypothetical protein